MSSFFDQGIKNQTASEKIRNMRIKSYKNNKKSGLPFKHQLTLFMIKSQPQSAQIGEILQRLRQNNYRILTRFWVIIDNKKKFFQNFYGHVDEKIISKQTQKHFSSRCLAIITRDHRAKMDKFIIKYLMRKKYGIQSFHVSDNWVNANREIAQLCDQTKLDYRGISDGFYHKERKKRVDLFF